MTPTKLFIATGETLYGPNYRSELGRALGVNERTIRRWVSGEYPVPDKVWLELAEFCQERHETLKLLDGPLRDAATMENPPQGAGS